MEPYMSQVMNWANNFAPRGWSLCNGQLVPISQNTALFSLLGTTYGGDGRTTFALPDLRGRVPIHNGTGLGLPTYRRGERGGAEVVSLTSAMIPSHTHLATAELIHVPPARSAVGTTTEPVNNAFATPAITIEGGGQADGTFYAADGTDLGAAPSAVSGTITLLNTGGGQAHENMQPFIAINYCIAMEGVYPSRN